MGSLSNLKLAPEVQDDAVDSLGGGYVLESGVYPMVIDLAYMGRSQGGANSLNLVFTHGKQTLKETLWVTSGDAKGNSPTYLNQRTGKQTPLPGMAMANALCFLTLGRELGDMDTEEKSINLYDFERKQEVPTKVAMIMDLVGQKIVLGVQKQIVDKRTKNDNGVYEATGETRQANEVDKMFQADTLLSIAEVRAGLTAGEFITQWSEKWTGETRDKSTKGITSKATAGAPAAATGATKSLFPS